MNHRKIILCLFFVVALSFVGVVYAQTYQTVTTITGNSGQTSDYFTIPTSEWRISWSYTPNPDYPQYAVFSAFIYPKDESAIYTEMVTKIGGNETSGVTYVHQGQKDFYIKTICANLDGYTIKVEAQQVGPSPSIPEFPPVALLAIVLAVALSSAVVFVAKNKARRFPSPIADYDVV